MNLWHRVQKALPTAGIVALILFLIAAGPVLVYEAGGTKTVYPHLLYVPVVIAALVFGARGGLVAGMLAGLVMGPWMPLDVEAQIPQETIGWVVRTGFFVLIGTLTGAGQRLFAERHRRLQSAQGELRRTEDRVRALVDAVSDYAIITLDPTGQVVTWNEGAERTFGYRAEAIIGHHFSRFYPPGDDLPARELEVATNERRCEHEGWRLRQDGSRFWANTVITALTDPDGGLEGFAKVTRDMTEAKQARERLEELVRSKDEFIAAVAHELRTPLTAVVGFAEILATGGLDPEETEELTVAIHHQATDLGGIVDDLLVAARIEIGRLSVSPVSVDLEREVRSAISSVPDAAGRIHVEGTGRAFADPARVRQVLRNLISNALRHGGRNISVAISEHQQSARVKVRDDGAGVPALEQEKIFAPYRTSNIHPGQPSSLGLGLAVSRKLASLMNGELIYRRENANTIFELVLPSSEANDSQLAG